MLGYVIKRIGLSFPLILGVTVITFLLTRVLPGDPARTIAGVNATNEVVEQIRQKFGLNQSLPVQYFVYLKDLFRGNMGVSIRSTKSVMQEIMARFPNSLSLVTLSVACAAVFGIVVGTFSAIHHYSVLDHIATLVSLFGVSIPIFWSGLMLISLFSVTLRWLPAGGFGTPAHFILPVFSLSLYCVANIMRVTRSSVLDVLHRPHVQVAESKGLPQWIVIYKHVVRNALMPILTIIGLQFGSLLGGIVLAETVFAWPGLGSLLMLSVFSRDYPVIQGIVLILAMVVIATNLVTDLAYAVIDPRVVYA